MDDDHVYIPLEDATTTVDGRTVVVEGSASITALDRDTGVVRWNTPIATKVPPVVAGGVLFVAADTEIHALNAVTGDRQWSLPIESSVRTPMILRGNLLVALMQPDELVAFRLDTREIAWRRSVGETGSVLMNADDRALYVSAGSRLLCVLLADGSVAWEQPLQGTLSEPALGRDRVLVGSTTRRFWAFNPRSGKEEWMWAGRIFGGDIIGAAVEGDLIYVASLDNIVRALNRGNGHQLSKKDIGTPPVLPPRAFFGVVVVVGVAPTISTFLGETLTPVSTWSAPPEVELQGPPLIDEHLKAFRVAIVVIMRDGRVTGLRPTAMTFPEPPAGTLLTLPGRTLPFERAPGEPEPMPVVAAPTPRR
jgi:outer membrane protein assembly factor BamB